MAAGMPSGDAMACFERCYKKLMVFIFMDDDRTRASLNLLLDELIALDCNSVGVNNEMGNTLMKKLCCVIPLKYERLVTKVCHVVHNFIKYKLVQHVNGDTSRTVTEYMIQALKTCASWVSADILRAMAVVMEDHWQPFLQHEDFLLGQSGIFVRVVDNRSPDVGTISATTHCLRCLAVRTTEREGLSSANAATCFTLFLNILHSIPSLQLLTNLQCRMIVECLQGVHSLTLNARIEVESHLGQLLAAVKGYMFHGLSQPVNIPSELFPTLTSDYGSKSPPSSVPGRSPRPNQPTPTSTRSKNKKSRKKKSEAAGKEASGVDNTSDFTENCDRPDEGAQSFPGMDSVLQSSWGRWTSSDSEFSDTDTGSHGGKSHIHSTRVRIAAFTCLAGVCKLVDKRAMFGYWAFFIPDSAAAGNSPQVQSLFTSILKDPSPKCRVGALVSLTAMLDGTKQFLAAAEETSNVRTSFTPLSNVLGAMIRELHRALLQALVVENYNLTLTQLIKCLATLVVNVPYHRLQPGLLSRVAKQLRHFLSHKDSNVRVACLTCLGAMASHQPPLLEVMHIMQSATPPVGMTKGLSAVPPLPSALTDSGVDTQSTSSPVTTSDTGSANASTLPVTIPSMDSSDPGTPTLGTSPGIHTPIFTDQMLQAQAQGTSWVIKLCLRNILPQPAVSSNGGGRGEEGGGTTVEPLPVRLESLQVLAAMCKGYFPVIRSQLKLMQGLIRTCLEDADSTVKLHGCKVLEELGAVMSKEIQETKTNACPSSQCLNIQQALQLWQSALDGPLLVILQNAQSSNPVRASACDCLASIGPDIFSLLSREQQQSLLKLVLQMTQCSDRLMVSAAVRALGFLVLYPCLSDDVTFVADAANAILKCLSVPSINVKIKAAWSLGNLCDALVVNKDREDVAFMDQFSDMLLCTVLTSATTATQDSDKVKCNAVRAVGNILRYLPSRSLGKSHTVEAVANSVKVMVKAMNNGPMKVRWNSCYAIANMLRNPLLLTGDAPWLGEVLTALSQVVRDCKNFKVRINAALALSVPALRPHYGEVALFVGVWESLLTSLSTAEDITDFAEFRYRDSLTEQVCLAALHMLSLSEAADITALLPALQTVGPVLKDHMHRFLVNRDSSKASAMKLVRQRLSTLGSGTDVTADLATGIQLLREVCLLESVEELEISPARATTAFRQIYD